MGVCGHSHAKSGTSIQGVASSIRSCRPYFRSATSESVQTHRAALGENLCSFEPDWNPIIMSDLVLVTGGTGFVGIHCIVALLRQGYQVRTTVRSLDRSHEVCD